MSTRRPGLRWIKRIGLGLVGFIVVVIGAVLIVVHTDWGRELVRRRVQAELATAFVGGGTIGKLEGSPFGELVMRDVVINGPDHRPAITIKTLHVELGILPLISHQARLAAIIAEDVDVVLDRDRNGELEISHLVTDEPSSWSVDLPKITIHRGHIAFDRGTEVMNLDDIEIDGAMHMPNGGKLEASVAMRARWREKATSVAFAGSVIAGDDATVLPSATLQVGQVSASVFRVEIAKPLDSGVRQIGGVLIASGPRAEVTRLVPEIELPDDVVAMVVATPAPGSTRFTIAGVLGKTQVSGSFDAELEAKRVTGTLATGELDLGRISGGELDGTGGGVITFDAIRGAAGALPTAHAKIDAWCRLGDLPRASLSIKLETGADRATAVFDARAEALQATLAADVRRIGRVWSLASATLVASSGDPMAASSGKAPVHGALHVDLSAHGELAPNPSLDITGKIDGSRLRIHDLSVDALHVAVDARQVPERSHGKVRIELENLARGTLRLGQVSVDAASRADGKIQVSVRSRPKQDRWLVDLDALVTPPGTGHAGDTVAIELQHHRVHTASGVDWTGDGGHVSIGPEHVELHDLRSVSVDGKLAVVASYERAGRRAGDLAAKLDVTGLTLDAVVKGQAGTIDAHLDVARRSGRLSGSADLEASGIAFGRAVGPFAANAKIVVGAGKLAATADASGVGFGKATLAFEIAVPTHITDPGAWTTLGRSAIRSSTLSVERLDVGRVAQAAGLAGTYRGRIDGDIQVSATATGGAIHMHELAGPPLHDAGPVDAELTISQTARDELTSTLVGHVEGLGGIEAVARVAMPERLFDRAAWKALGRDALRAASLRADNITIEPGVLDRFDIVTALRARLDVVAVVSRGGRSGQLVVDLRDLRGSPIAQPLDIHVDATIDDHAANTSLTVRSKQITLLEAHGQLAVGIAQLRADPGAVTTMALSGLLTIPETAVAQLLAVFGRNEIASGTATGTVEIAGTIANPTVHAHLAGTAVQARPGLRGKSVRTLDQITLDASWDGTTGKLALSGIEQGGKLDLVVQGSPSARDHVSAKLVATSFELTPLLVFAPGPAGGTSGQLDADLTLAGIDPRTAKVAGQLHLTGGRIPIAPDVGTLRKATIDVRFEPHQIELAIAGKLDAGNVKLDGAIALDGGSLSGGNAKITLRKVSLIGVVQPVIDADISARLARKDQQWTADIAIERATISIPKDRGEELKQVGAPVDMRFVSGGQIAAHRMKRQLPETHPIIVANITLKKTEVEAEGLRTTLHGKLVVTADRESVGVQGTISAQRGDFDLFGRRYQVEHASGYFDGSTDPILDVRITHEFADVTSITEIHGRSSAPELVMKSDPATYTQGQLLGFLLGGEPRGDPASGDSSGNASGAGESFVANQIGGRIRGALPINLDVLRYEGSSATSGSAITVGKWISRSIFVAYRQHLENRPDENTGEGEVEYWLSRRLVLEGTVGDRSFDGLDLLWRKRY